MKGLIVTVLSLMIASSTAMAGNWWENVKVKGDLRYRHEMIDTDNADARHRHRLRARLGVYGTVSDRTKVGIQLATGSEDPVSTNQTLDGAFSTKRVGVDLAYLQTGHEKLPCLTVLGGKFKNPFFKPGKSELIWDSDFNPEGGAVKINKSSDDVDVQLLGAGLWIDESSSGDDAWLGAAQGMLRLHFNEKKSSVAVGGSYYSYVNIEGHTPFYDAEDPLGNTVNLVDDGGDTVMQYANDYDLFEAYVEVTHKFEKVPVTVMGDYVKNTSADSLDTGWLIGLRVGSAKEPGSWAFRYIYREVKADAVVGIFADSDFRGGGSDAKGHEIGGSLALDKNTFFNVSYFANKIGLDAAESDFSRLQVDLQLKF